MPGSERRLAAILCADVVGYSRLMAQDEAGTVERVQALRETTGALIRRHNGRVVDAVGDNLLADFASVVDAVACAVQIQGDLEAQNGELPEGRRMLLRIGINLGDVIIDSDRRLYGDGVNVAARIEALAPEGGICISGTAFDQVKNKLDLGFRFLGEQRVKNITDPVRTYRVLMEPGAARGLVGASGRLPWRRAALATGLVGALGFAAWLQPWAPELELASVEKMAFPLPDRPSIAVLPFTNLSGDPEQDYFADGMTDDLITDLSQLSGLFVIARNSVFQYKARPVSIRQVAEDLGVRYVLESSVRRVGDRIRVNAQLIDATTGGHLWAERYDPALTDVFAMQDEVTRAIVAALALNLTPEEQTRSTQRGTINAEAYDAFLRGWAHYRNNTPGDFAEAIPYFEEAIALDSSYGHAHAALAAVYQAALSRDFTSGIGEWTRSLGIPPDDILPIVKEYLKEARGMPDPLLHQVASQLRTYQGRHDDAIVEAEQAIALDRNDPLGYEALAAALIYAGRPAEGLETLDTAMRLDPRFPKEYFYWRGLGQFGAEQMEDANLSLERAVELNPDDDRALIVLASAQGHLGRIDRARATIEILNKLRRVKEEERSRAPETRVEIGVDTMLAGPYTLQDVDLWPYAERPDRERVREGLRAAGLPASGPAHAESPLEVTGAITVDVTEAKALFDRGTPIVDVRGVADWNIGHIPGAIHLELKEVFSEATLLEVIDRDDEFVVHCEGAKCLRSSKACEKAVAWGFTNVYYFRNGFPAWRAAGHPVDVAPD